MVLHPGPFVAHSVSVGTGSHGLTLVFDPSLDGGGWPGSLGERAACMGESWVGPEGLLARLETELGLGRVLPRAAERSAHLAHALHGADGYWRASYETDPLGAARRLLADRDALWLWGWRGQPVSQRLSELAKATAAALPGVPDRLQAIAQALGTRRPDIESLAVCLPEALLPTRWQHVFDKLRALGIDVHERQIAPTAAKGDLGRARSTGFAPVGDGTLTLLRAHGPLAAADEVAGCLAALDSLAGVLVVGADNVLVSALAHKGLPRPHAAGRATASMAAIRLVVEAMFYPADPSQLYGLLSLDPGPIPRSIARELINALSRLPGRGSEPWKHAIDDGLSRVDESRRERVRERVLGLLEPAAARDESVEVAAVRRRLRLLSTWARGAAVSAESVATLATAAEVFANILSGLPAETFSRVQLQRLVDELEDFGADGAHAQAGLAAVREPGAVLGPARIVVWWGFSRDRARRPARLRLSENERAALGALGVTPPNAGTMARAEALRWRRPLEQATDALVLACPRTTETGDPAFPHPLWDELTAAMGGGSAVTKLVAPRLRLPAEPQRRTMSLRPLPVGKVAWSAGRALALRDTGESPSSLEKLLGCSFAWALHYPGRMREPLEAPATPGPLLYGQIAHHIMAEIFAAGPPPEGRVQARAEAALDRLLGEVCETLLLPRFQVERAELTQVVTASAVELARLIAAVGAQVRGVEVPLAKTLAALSLAGRADLLLSDPDVVIDLKWGRAANQNKLAAGAALQLAAYATLAQTGAARPEVAYFVLRSQELLGEPGTALPHADIPGERVSSDTWHGALAALAAVVPELTQGMLNAPGALGDDAESVLDGDVLRIAPGCRYCRLDGLCGRRGVR